MNAIAAALLYLIARGEGIEPGELMAEMENVPVEVDTKTVIRDLEMAVEKIKERHAR